MTIPKKKIVIFYNNLIGDWDVWKKSSTQYRRECLKMSLSVCPVYNECLEKNNERLFCSIGNTECNIEKKDVYTYTVQTK